MRSAPRVSRVTLCRDGIAKETKVQGWAKEWALSCLKPASRHRPFLLATSQLYKAQAILSKNAR